MKLKIIRLVKQSEKSAVRVHDHVGESRIATLAEPLHCFTATELDELLQATWQEGRDSKLCGSPTFSEYEDYEDWKFAHKLNLGAKAEES